MVTTQGFNALLKIVEEPPRAPEVRLRHHRAREGHRHHPLAHPPLPVPAGAARPAAGLPGRALRRRRASRSSRPCCRSSCAPVAARCATRCRCSTSSSPAPGRDGLTYEPAAALLGFTDGALLDEVDRRASPPATARRCSASSTRSIETGPRPAPVRRGPARAAARPHHRRGGARRRRRRCCSTCPRTSSSGCARQAAAFGAGALSRAADVVNAGLTEMRGATAPRLQLELHLRPRAAARRRRRGAGTPRGSTASSAASTSAGCRPRGVPYAAPAPPAAAPRRLPPQPPSPARCRTGRCRAAGVVPARPRRSAPDDPGLLGLRPAVRARPAVDRARAAARRRRPRPTHRSQPDREPRHRPRTGIRPAARAPEPAPVTAAVPSPPRSRTPRAPAASTPTPSAAPGPTCSTG